VGLGNGDDGVHVESRAANDLVARNLISANNGAGVVITDDAENITVQSNFIGTDRAGGTVTGTDNKRLGNALSGVWIDGTPDNLIGGDQPGQGNVISGNSLQGIKITGAKATQNQIQGNFIGTDKNGMVALGNKPAGIWLDSGANDNTIGRLDQITGTLPVLTGAANLISGNGSFGVVIYGSQTTGNLVAGNFIGTAANGEDPLGNGPAASTLPGGGVAIIRAPSSVPRRPCCAT
jgi:titin